MADFDSSQPIRTENRGDVQVVVVDTTTPTQGMSVDVDGKVSAKLSDGSGNEITSQVNGSQQALDVGINVSGVQVDPRDVRPLTAADTVTAEQGTTPWVVSSTDLDIRDLTAAQDNVAISDGTNTLSIFSDGSVGVRILDGSPGVDVSDYNTAAAVAAGSTSNHTYTSTGNFYLTQIEAAGSGKIKIEVIIDGATKFVQFNSVSTPNTTLVLKNPILVTTGKTVVIARTNRDLQAQDLYSTVVGYTE